MKKFILLLIAFTGTFWASSDAQTCEPNMDFSLGNYSNWVYYVGTCCTGTGLPSFTLTTTPPAAAYIPCEFALAGTAAGGSVAITGIDPFGGFPVVGTGSYSLRIGSNRTNNAAEKAEYYVHVPTGSTNYSIIYHYAVVLENPGGPASNLPKFSVSAIDSNSGLVLPCANFNYVLGGLPGFVGPVSNAYAAIPSYGCPDQAAAAISGWTADVYYKPWDSTVIDLSKYGGHTIIMSFSASDGAISTAFGYGYINMTCGIFAINTIANCTSYTTQFIAPAGFASYAWYDSLTFTHLYGTTDTITLPFPAAPTTYAVILTPYVGFGCPDTLYTTPLPGLITISSNTIVCLGDTSTLSSSVPGGTWSSVNTSIATIGSSSGVVSGIMAGTSVISYSTPTGCYATATVTVTPPPSAITGVAAVCAGSSIILSDAISGGTWSSSNGNATVGSVSGVVTGVSSTTPSPTITYALSIGCAATTTVTVNPISPIMGVANICALGGTVALLDGAAGGIWSGTGALVNSTTGVVTGVAAGPATITYTTPAGCTATTSLTVNPIPGPITGGTAVCVGATISLSDATSGGVWSSGTASTATVSGSGVVSGVSAGTTEITYSLPGGCSSIDTVTVNACVTSVPAIAYSNIIDIYPNPSNTLLNITATNREIRCRRNILPL